VCRALQVITAAAELAQLPVDMSSDSRADLLAIAQSSIESATLAHKGISSDDAGTVLALLARATGSSAAPAGEASLASNGAATEGARSALHGIVELLMVAASPATEGGFLTAGDSGLHASASSLPGSWYDNTTIAAGPSTQPIRVTFMGQLAGRCTSEDDAAATVACSSGIVKFGLSYIEDRAGYVTLPAAIGRQLLEEPTGLQLLSGVVELTVSAGGWQLRTAATDGLQEMAASDGSSISLPVY
jgi:hypothetical protein